MDQFYVTPDGQIAQLPRRSFLDRLTSGLYDASVEFRRPGGGQEARLARTQPLTSALNQYGQQKRSFDQQANILGRTQEFSAGQNALDRAFRTSERLAGQQFTSGENELQRQLGMGLQESAQKFNREERTATQGFTAGENAAERALRQDMQKSGFGHDVDMSRLGYIQSSALRQQDAAAALRQLTVGNDLSKNLLQFQYDNDPLRTARVDLMGAQAALAKFKAQPDAPISPEELKVIIATLPPEDAARVIQAAELLYAQGKSPTLKQLSLMDRLQPGTSGALPFDLFGVGGQPVAPAAPSTNTIKRITGGN